MRERELRLVPARRRVRTVALTAALERGGEAPSRGWRGWRSTSRSAGRAERLREERLEELQASVLLLGTAPGGLARAAPEALEREIREAESVAELAEARGRLPAAVRPCWRAGSGCAA